MHSQLETLLRRSKGWRTKDTKPFEWVKQNMMALRNLRVNLRHTGRARSLCTSLLCFYRTDIDTDTSSLCGANGKCWV